MSLCQPAIQLSLDTGSGCTQISCCGSKWLLIRSCSCGLALRVASPLYCIRKTCFLAGKDVWGWSFGLLGWLFLLCTEVNTQPSNISLAMCSIPKSYETCLGLSLRQTMGAGKGQSWPFSTQRCGSVSEQGLEGRHVPLQTGGTAGVPLPLPPRHSQQASLRCRAATAP